MSKYSMAGRSSVGSGGDNLSNCIDGYSNSIISSSSSRMISTYDSSSSSSSRSSSGSNMSANYISSNYDSNNNFKSNTIIPCVISSETAVQRDTADCLDYRGKSWISIPQKQNDEEIMKIGEEDTVPKMKWIGNENYIDTLRLLHPKSSIGSSSLPVTIGLSLPLLSSAPCSPVKVVHSKHDFVQVQHREQEYTEDVDMIPQRHKDILYGHCHLLLDRDSLLSQPPIYFDSRMMAMVRAHNADANNDRNGKKRHILSPSLSSALSSFTNSPILPSSPIVFKKEDLHFLSRTELSVVESNSNRLRVLNSINSSNSLHLRFRRITHDRGKRKNDDKYCDVDGNNDDLVSVGGLYDIYIRDSSAAHDCKDEGKSANMRDYGYLKNVECGFNDNQDEGNLLLFIVDSIARNNVHSHFIPQSQSHYRTPHVPIPSTSQLPASVTQWLRRQVQWVVWTLGALERRSPGELLY